MRADRLLSILLLLQTHKRMTTADLAARLEASPRTIHRDMEALSTAGVPVTAERGAQGGWSLLEPYQTRLNGLNADEIRALFLTTPAQLLTDLGLRSAYEGALIKLQAALPSAQQHGADDIRQRIHVDMPGWKVWADEQTENTCFPLIQAAVLHDLRLKMTYQKAEGEAVVREVDPLGLVFKGRQWYLIAAVDESIRTYRVSRIQDAHTLDQAAQRPPDFDLAAYWAESQAEFVAGLPRYSAVLRLRADMVEWARSMWRFTKVERVDPPDADGWCVVHVTFETLIEATGSVLLCGPYARALEPDELRDNVRAWVEAIRSASLSENQAD